METSVEQLIKERTFASLSEVELLSVSELCESEEEFQTMKAFFMELDTVAVSQQTIIHPDIKKSLDSIYTAKYPGLTANWTAPEAQVAQAARIVPFYQKTWVRVAAVGLIVLGTVPFWSLLDSDSALTNENKLTAKLESPMSEEASNSSKSKELTTPAKNDLQSVALADNIQPIEEIKESSASDESEVKEPTLAAVSYSRGYVEPGVSAGTLAFSSPKALESKAINVELFDGSTGEKISSFSSVGREADLHPNDLANNGKKQTTAVSLAEEPDDLLDFLVPAF